MSPTKTRSFRCGVLSFLLLISANGSANAAPPKNEKAEARAIVYQAETRAVFSGHGWRIARDKPGVLIMEHNIGFAPSYGGLNTPDFVNTGVFGVAQLIIKFKPQSAVDTSCIVDAREYSTRKQDRKQDGKQDEYSVLHEGDLDPPSKDKPLNGPYPLKNEELLGTIKDLLGKARARLIKGHPEFAVK